MSDEKNTLNDINSGKGLPPINTDSNGNHPNHPNHPNPPKGLTIEQRNTKVIRNGKFPFNRNSSKKGKK